MPEDAATLGRLYAQAHFELMDQLPPSRSETVEDFTKAMMDLFIKTSVADWASSRLSEMIQQVEKCWKVPCQIDLSEHILNLQFQLDTWDMNS